MDMCKLGQLASSCMAPYMYNVCAWCAQDQVTAGKISNAQLETVVYSAMRFHMRLDPEPGGFAGSPYGCYGCSAGHDGWGGQRLGP